MKKYINIPLREDYLKIVGGDCIKALLLNQLVYWSKRTKDTHGFVTEEMNRLTLTYEPVSPNYTFGWIYKSYAELNEDILHITSDKTVERRMKELVAEGLVFVRDHPNPRDNRKQYRVNLSLLFSLLKEMGSVIPEYEQFGIAETLVWENRDPVDESPSQPVESLRQHDETLTEITSLDFNSFTSLKDLKSDGETYATDFKSAILPSLLEVYPSLRNYKPQILLAYHIVRKNAHYSEETFVATLIAVAQAQIKQSFLGYLLIALRNNFKTEVVSIEEAKTRIRSKQNKRKGNKCYTWVDQPKTVAKEEQPEYAQKRINKMEERIAYLKQEYGYIHTLRPQGKGVPIDIWLQVNEDAIEEKMIEFEQQKNTVSIAEVEALIRQLA